MRRYLHLDVPFGWIPRSSFESNRSQWSYDVKFVEAQVGKSGILSESWKYIERAVCNKDWQTTLTECEKSFQKKGPVQAWMIWNILKNSTLGKPKLRILDDLVTSSDVKAWFHAVTNCNVISDRSLGQTSLSILH